jgi:hypothetical protein
MVSLCLALICLLLCPALRVFVHLTWLVAWLSCLLCRIWCKIIIIIIAQVATTSTHTPVTQEHDFMQQLLQKLNASSAAFLV